MDNMGDGMRKKLLISGAGGSLFPYLTDVLSERYELILTDSSELVKKLYPERDIRTVPKVVDPSFEKVMTEIIKNDGVDYYIPLIDEEILIAHRIAEKCGIRVLSPAPEFVSLCLDKLELMKALAERGISVIHTDTADRYDGSFGFPLFLKPKTGRGSRGAMKICSQEAFSAYFVLENYAKDEVLVQPYVGGQEYTVSVTANSVNRLISVVPKIVYQKQGVTKHAACLHHKGIETLCRKIVETFVPCGSFNVQLKEDGGKLYIFEINPRYSTTLVLSTAAGINEIDLNIEYIDDKNAPYLDEFKSVELIRRWENVFYG
jgi:carbamoyl-phosphate synthase large subunit